jgi:ABC-2 type transport system permease protein
MNKISLIIQREYLTRVKKKSFIIMTILGPILMAGIGVIFIYLSIQKAEKQNIEVIDESFLFKNDYKIPEKKFIHFDYPPISFEQAQKGFYDTQYDAILYIPHNIFEGGRAVKLFYKNQIGIASEEYIENTISKIMYDVILSSNKVNLNAIKEAETNSKINILTEKLEATGKSKKTNTVLLTYISMAGGILIYIFIFLYGIQVMRGVMEEKTIRIVEVILSSVKPFQLMIGKIIGVALVGLTQFLLWVILTSILYSFATITILKDVEIKQIQQNEEVIKVGANLDYTHMKKIDTIDGVTKFWNDFKSVDIVTILFCFVFYFLAGYLMYSALYAAVGSSVDSEADTQQFLLPVTIPLILAFVISMSVPQDPTSSVAFWFSIIPLTSPIVMMARLPFGVPAWELALSMCVLVISFIFTTWLAARIYRTGILMYGKKVTWKELGKWLFYKA